MPLVSGLAILMVPVAWAAEAINPSKEALLAQGNKLWKEGKVEEARKSFEQAVSANPGSIDAHMKLGGLLLYDHNYTAAIGVYQQTISLDAKNAKAWIGLGVAYLHTGKRELSKAAFDEAVLADPSRKEQLAGLTEKFADK